MLRLATIGSFCMSLSLMFSTAVWAAEPVTLDNVVAPVRNDADEPIVKSFSLDQAANFLDSASLQWQKQRKCMTCHTNYAYLYARPVISADAPAHRAVRRFAEQLVMKRWPEKGPRWDAEVIATAAALAFNDAATTGKLHPATRIALDRMWTIQRDDGGWSWLKCGWPPLESDDHYGVTLAAIAVGVAPGDYAKTEVAKRGLAGIRKYLGKNPPTTLHQQAMLLWASSYSGGLMSATEKKKCIEQLLSLQKKDGGWALATLGDWKRSDGKKQDLKTSDGYGTGFVIYALRRGGKPADSSEIRRGIGWLKTHQRRSGRWFTRSLNKDSRHFISHAGTAMAVMALSACDPKIAVKIGEAQALVK
jgi:squalene-hopene/tetraprenyl-beta-curcumene cyclase